MMMMMMMIVFEAFVTVLIPMLSFFYDICG